MNRAEIPDKLLKSRGAEIDRIPGRVLKTLTRADLVNRLLAAGEYRHRASAPHLDGDLYRLRIGQASEVLTTDDPKRAAELVKGAGVGVTIGAGKAARPAPAVPRTAARPAMAGALRKAPGIGQGAARRAFSADMSYITAEVAWQRSPAGRALAKAAEYERKAYVVTDPETRRGYLDLAKGLRTQTA